MVADHPIGDVPESVHIDADIVAKSDSVRLDEHQLLARPTNPPQRGSQACPRSLRPCIRPEPFGEHTSIAAEALCMIQRQVGEHPPRVHRQRNRRPADPQREAAEKPELDAGIVDCSNL